MTELLGLWYYDHGCIVNSGYGETELDALQGTTEVISAPRDFYGFSDKIIATQF